MVDSDSVYLPRLVFAPGSKYFDDEITRQSLRENFVYFCWEQRTYLLLTVLSGTFKTIISNSFPLSLGSALPQVFTDGINILERNYRKNLENSMSAWRKHEKTKSLP